jgi:hypothetical protein
MSGEIALDTSVAVRFLNGDSAIVSRVLALPEVILPITDRCSGRIAIWSRKLCSPTTKFSMLSRVY